MAFKLKNLKQVIDEMMSTMRAYSRAKDFNRGSIVRTTLEAAALQIADLYLQLAKLKELFSIDSASGTDLDDRAGDYGLARNQPVAAYGNVKVGDTNVSKKVAAVTVTSAVDGTSTYIYFSGFTSGTIFDLPTSGVVILERDTPAQRENVSYSAIDTGLGRLTISSTVTKSHPIGSTVILSYFGADKTVSSGTTVQVPATGSTQAIEFTTNSSATFVDGEVFSPAILSTATAPGSAGNVADKFISAFTSPPWPTATVTNDVSFGGGADTETDADFRNRIKFTIQNLTKATVRAIKEGVTGIVSGSSKVLYARIVEDVLNNLVYLYINDGSLTPPASTDESNPEVIIFNAEANQKRGKVAHWPIVDDLNLWRSDHRGTSTSVVTAPGTATVIDGTASFGSLTGYVAIDPNQNIFTVTGNTGTSFDVSTSGTDPVAGVYALVPVGVLPTARLVRGTDYNFNETTGDVELVSGLAAKDTLVAYPAHGDPSYSYYTGLIQEVQRVVNADPSDFVNYPGLKAAGVKVKIVWPDIRVITMALSISASPNVSESSLYPQVKQAIETYVNSLNIGDNVILAEVIAVVMGVSGVADVNISSPSSNIIILDNQLARTSVSNISVS